jgi:hypothetical protein
MLSIPSRSTLPSRHRAILRAVEAGRGEALCGCAPDLLIDGRFCDHAATGDLFRTGLLATGPGPLGSARWFGSPTKDECSSQPPRDM